MGDNWWDNLPIFGNRLVKDDPNYVRTPAARKARREKGMAGSYNHVITQSGNLRNNESFVQMIENLGDAYEATEEMYGMIWWLAHMAPDAGAMSPADLVENARQNYTAGLELAKANPNKAKRES